MTTRPTKRLPAGEWVYHGLWKALADWFNVPESPPDLPMRHDESTTSFHPARAFLAYLKLYFWIVLLIVDALILLGWIVVVTINPVVGAILALPALLIAIVPDVVAYIAIHLRYDTTWFVLSPRSLRVRRGVWVIREQTITFENVQDVKVTRGPIQQMFGIASVTVSTAGGGGSEGSHGGSDSHNAVIEGIDNPGEIRTLIMSRVRASRSAGLGDEDDASHGAASHATPSRSLGPTLTPAHVDLLRDIRDGLRAIA